MPTILHNDRLAKILLLNPLNITGSIRLVHREKFWSNFLLKHLPTDRYPSSKSKTSWKTTKKERLFNIFYSMKPSTTKSAIATCKWYINVLFFRNSKLSEKQTLNEIKNASTPGGLDELRAKLKEIRSKRNSPPSIEILQNESPLHA